MVVVKWGGKSKLVGPKWSKRGKKAKKGQKGLKMAKNGPKIGSGPRVVGIKWGGESKLVGSEGPSGV